MKSFVLIFAVLSICIAQATAQDWPSKPVRIIVPSAPGGGTDTYPRTMSSALAEVLKPPFMLENRPGGNGNIGAEVVDKMALVPQFGSPDEFAARLKSERERWAGIIKRLNLKIDD